MRIKSILWLATDRSNRVADIFGPLQREVGDIVDTDYIFRQIDMLPKAWQQRYTKKGGMKPPKLIDVKLANQYDFIMVDAPFAFLDEDWSKIKTKKGVLIEDQHGDVLEYSKRYKKLGFDIFFTRYNSILKQHPWLKGQNIKWLPHSIDPYIFNDYEQPKKYDCLMIGRIQENVYPIRWKIHQKMIKSNINYFKVDRPEENTPKHTRWPVKDKYASLINSSRITFTCSSKFKYPVGKFFEIPACKSALFSDYNGELKELGFIPGYNMINVGNGDNILSSVKLYLKSPEELEQIANNGYDLIHKKHKAKNRAEQFMDYIEED